jgi:hypothetical protein
MGDKIALCYCSADVAFGAIPAFSNLGDYMEWCFRVLIRIGFAHVICLLYKGRRRRLRWIPGDYQGDGLVCRYKRRQPIPLQRYGQGGGQDFPASYPDPKWFVSQMAAQRSPLVLGPNQTGTVFSVQFMKFGAGSDLEIHIEQ